MTMPSRPYPGRALAAWSVVYVLAIFATADHLSTATTTVRSTTTILTLTTTITSGQTTYATTELLTPTTTIEIPGATPSMTLGSGQGVYGGHRFDEAVLNSTNIFRQQHQARPLTWDNGLAAFGQRHAEKCVWEHSGGPHGENLALNFADPTLAIDAWANEEKKYDYQSASFSEATGHFTQLVWEGTTKVGCGAVKCNSDSAKGWFLVCEYDPPGNVIGAFRENVDTPKGGKEGEIGLNAAMRMGGVSKLLVALVAVSSVAIACL